MLLRSAICFVLQSQACPNLEIKVKDGNASAYYTGFYKNCTRVVHIRPRLSNKGGMS